jgi:hypothetical protein
MPTSQPSGSGSLGAEGKVQRLLDEAASEGAEVPASEQMKGAAGDAALLLPKPNRLAAADAEIAAAGMLPKLTLPNAVVAVPLLP